MGGGDLTGCLSVQRAILRAIEQMEPPCETAPGTRARLLFEVLRCRYMLRLTQEDTAERLGVSVTSVWRLQREAVHALAILLSGQDPARLLGGESPPERELASMQAADWAGQTKRELASLRATTPDMIANLDEVVSGVVDLAAAMTSPHPVEVEIAYMQPGLTVAIHPNVLRQMLIASIHRLTWRSPTGRVTIYAGLESGSVKITMTAPVSADACDDGQLTDNMLVPDGARIGASLDSGEAVLWLELPSVGSVTVLVVDDNPDIVRFYQRCTDGTNYRIVQNSHGRDIFASIDLSPDIIVLDVMLPEVDGWELLARLRQHPDTRSIPVIVCSVVREEELALSLGATRFLAKPVSAKEFTHALDEALESPRGRSTAEL